MTGYYKAKFKREQMMRDDPTIRANDLKLLPDRAGIVRVVDLRPPSQKTYNKALTLVSH